MQIHDDIAYNRVEAFNKGDDTETLVGTETPKKRALRRLATSKASPAQVATRTTAAAK